MLPQRDLLVLTKSIDDSSFEEEVTLLNKLLYTTENVYNFCIANEVIDINNYKIIASENAIKKVIKMKKLKPFVFICNKN